LIVLHRSSHAPCECAVEGDSNFEFSGDSIRVYQNVEKEVAQ
jgi:hypothetical protein